MSAAGAMRGSSSILCGSHGCGVLGLAVSHRGTVASGVCALMCVPCGGLQRGRLTPGSPERAMTVWQPSDRSSEPFQGLLLLGRGRAGLTQRQLADGEGESARSIQDGEEG